MGSPQAYVGWFCLTCGAALAALNWLMVWRYWRTGRPHSVVAPVGGAGLCVGALLHPPLRPYAWAAPLLDVGTLALLLAAPRLAREWWSTSWFSLLDEYVGRRGRTTVRVRQYRRGVLTLRWDVARPSGEFGVLGMGNVGTWEAEAGRVTLRVNGEPSVLEPIPDAPGRYRVVGLRPHPQYAELSFDGVELERNGSGR